MKELDRLQAWRAAAPRFWRRQAKTLRQVSYGWGHPKQISFLFGCQRSGTKMLMRVLDRSPATRIFHENHAAAFHDFQLRSDGVVRGLVRLNPAPCQIFKPICDSQHADALLRRFPEARAVWLYRHYDDVAMSAVHKWGGHQADVIRALVDGDLGRWGWRTERVPPGVVDAIRSVYRPDLSAEEGALLFWYLRNALFFELGLHLEPRAQLVKYERLVRAPEQGFRAVFAHVGAPYFPEAIEGVHADSVGRRAAPHVREPIRALCAELLARLDAVPPPVERRRPTSLLVLVDRLSTGGAERYAVGLSNWVAGQGGAVTLAAAPGELRREISPAVHFAPTPYTWDTGGTTPRAVSRVRGLLGERRPAVIVTNSLLTTWVARVARGRGNTPIVAVAHGWPERRYRIVSPLLRGADRVVAVSAEVRNKLVANGLDAARCEVVFNGVECERLGQRAGELRAAARAAMGAGPDDLLVVNVGRLSDQKAHEHVISVAARMRGAHPRLRYAIVGGGERAAELAALLRSAGVSDRVRLLGLRADVPDLLGSADIFLSCSNWEGMPLSTIEAMASSLPAVATRTEGTAHLVTPECGVIVPVGDTAAIGRALARLAADPGLRRRMGAAGRRRALAEFSHDRMAGQLMGVFNRMTPA